MTGSARTMVDHRALGIELFNRTWELIEARAPADELIHAAHASAYHWMQAGTQANRARSEWLCARVYATLGRPEPALHHARRCLELVEGAPDEMEDFDLAGAYEALARAHAAAGDRAGSRSWQALGEEACRAISNERDRAPILADLRGVPSVRDE